MHDLRPLAQCLPRTTRDLAKMGRAMGMKVGGGEDAAELRAAITGELSSQEPIARLLDRQPAAALRLLTAIAWHGEGTISGSAIDAREQSSVKPVLVREHIEPLVAQGLLFSLGSRDFWARRPGYSLSEESAVWIGAICPLKLAMAEGKPLFVSSAEAEPSALSWDWLSDLVRVAGELGRRPAGITQQGLIYRRDADRLERFLAARDLPALSGAWEAIHEDFAEHAARYGPWSEDAAPRLGLVLWLALGLGLVKVQEGQIRPARGWQRRLERAGVAEIWRRAMSAALHLHLADVPARYLFMLLQDDLWLPVRRLLRTVSDAASPLYSPVSPVAIASFVLAMGRLGVLEAAEIDGDPALRLSEAGRTLRNGTPPAAIEEKEWTVLQNGDVLAPPYLSPGLRAQLEELARPEKVDVVTTYRLSPESLQRALERGAKRDEVLRLLERHGRGPLPQAVRFRIEEWSGHAGRFSLWEAALLYCRSAEDVQEALSIRAVRDSVIEQLGDQCLVIRAQDEDKVREALGRQGLALAEKVQRPSGLVREDAVLDIHRPSRNLRFLAWGKGQLIEPL